VLPTPLLIFGEETPHWRGTREFLVDALANDLSGIGRVFLDPPP
jgi:hypothetical protein